MYGTDKSTLIRWVVCFALALLLHAAIAVAMLITFERHEVAQSSDSVVHVNLVAAAPSVQGAVENSVAAPDRVAPEQQKVSALPPSTRPFAAIAPTETITPKTIMPSAVTPVPVAPNSVEQSHTIRDEEVDANRTAPPQSEATLSTENKTALQAEAIASWHQQVRLYLHRHKRYPRQALARRQEGVVTVRVVIDRRGKVIASALVKSAGQETLDRAAIELLVIASPLPAPPNDASDHELTLDIPIEYHLK